METKDKIIEFARSLWTSGHARYEEMCVLAATAQLGGAQMCELNKHVAQCSSCHRFLEEIAQISFQALPLLSRKTAELATPPDGLRGRFFARLAREGNREDLGLTLEVIPGCDGGRQTSKAADPMHKIPPAAKKHRRGLQTPTLQWLAAGLAACLLAAWAAFVAGENRNQGIVIPVSRDRAFESPVQVEELKGQKAELESRLSTLKQKLSTARAEQNGLAQELAEARANLQAYANQTRRDSASADFRSQETTDEVGALRRQVEKLNYRLAESDIKLGIQLQTTEELRAKLEAVENELQSARELSSARSQAGDLVAARNLHIIDVYDSDNKGNRQRSYGRVFYVEGKSLIFYAYDLQDAHRVNANVVFRVWGEKSGMKESTHSLGILRNDQAGENRWTMTFDDPKILAQINSVFVTSETDNRRNDTPHGKKVLYAYIGNRPNHP